jgi:hypothetical protein
MNRGKAEFAGLLLIGSVTLTATPAFAQVYPTCPPEYYFAPDYGLCFPAGYAYGPSYYYNQGYYLYAPGFFFFSAPATPLPFQPVPPATRFTTGQIGPFTTGVGPFTTSPTGPGPRRR